MPAEPTSIVDSQAEIEGQLRGRDARILGRFRGEIDLKGRLETAEGSEVEARLQAEVAEISGLFVGEIVVRRLVLLEKARVEAKVTADALIMRDGARLDGSVTVSGGRAGELHGPTRPKPPAQGVAAS